MSEKYVKIQALQAAPYTATNNRIEFIIPQSFGKVSLRDSFIQVYLQATGTTTTAGGLPMVCAQWSPDGTVGNAVDTYTDNVALIRNARISSAIKGSIESVRRTDVLRQNLNTYVRKTQTQVDSDNYIAINPQQQLINGQRASPFQQINKLGNTASINNNNVPAMVRLGDILDFCNVEVLDCGKTGDLRINLEMNINRFVARQVKPLIVNGAGAVDDIAAPVGDTNINTLTVTAKFEHLEEIPFYVSQELTVTGNVNGVADSEATAIVQSITQAADGTLSIQFNATLFTLTPGNGGLADGVLSIPNAATTTLNWNLAELVVKQLNMNVVAPPSVMYHEFMTYELNANNLTNYTHVVEIDGSTDSAILMPVDPANNIVAQKVNDDLQNYEFSLNNISLSDNRLVDLYSSFYLDRFVAAMRAADYVARNLSNPVFETNGLQTQTENAILATPLFQTASRKNLQIQINSTTGLGQYILYCSRPRIMDF